MSGILNVVALDIIKMDILYESCTQENIKKSSKNGVSILHNNE